MVVAATAAAGRARQVRLHLVAPVAPLDRQAERAGLAEMRLHNLARPRLARLVALARIGMVHTVLVPVVAVVVVA